MQDLARSMFWYLRLFINISLYLALLTFLVLKINQFLCDRFCAFCYLFLINWIFKICQNFKILKKFYCFNIRLEYNKFIYI
jgi:hypothetical protein